MNVYDAIVKKGIAMKIMDTLRDLLGFKKGAENHVLDSSEGEMEKPVDMLKALPWLSLLDDEVFQKVIDGFKCRQFPEGAILVKEEDPDNGMFVIVSGRVRIEIRGITMNEVGSGSLIGEMSVLTAYPRSASVVAVSEVKVVWIESDTLKSIMKKSAGRVKSNINPI